MIMTTHPVFHSEDFTRQSVARTQAADVTFIACVESGPLETQTVLMAESLRRWGGRFAECPVLAITPRKGAPLRPDTREAFDRLGVAWISFDYQHEADWYGPMNKPVALAHGEELATTGTVVWMDSDTLVVGEPEQLELGRDADFAAIPSSRRLDVASDGKNEHEPFWRAMLEWHGFDPSSYPFIPAQTGETGPIRMYWQGGVFAYRRSSGLGETHLSRSLSQIRSRIASRHSGAYFSEQTSLALAVHEKRLRHRVLPASHNLMINPLAEGLAPGWGELRQARIVHYFGSLWPDSFDEFVGRFNSVRPDVASWLRSMGPLADGRPLFRRLHSRLVRARRRRDGKAYLRQCQQF